VLDVARGLAAIILTGPIGVDHLSMVQKSAIRDALLG